MARDYTLKERVVLTVSERQTGKANGEKASVLIQLQCGYSWCTAAAPSAVGADWGASLLREIIWEQSDVGGTVAGEGPQAARDETPPCAIHIGQRRVDDYEADQE
jgi:hypothetical protein